VRVVVRLRVVEVTYEEVGDGADEEKEQNHDDQPRYSEAPIGTSVEDTSKTRTVAGTEWSRGTDVT
jgi:hypothetical protein